MDVVGETPPEPKEEIVVFDTTVKEAEEVVALVVESAAIEVEDIDADSETVLESCFALELTITAEL